ncbi:MAG TPA: single-stranded DNA-binding protein [Clostridiaceae bacterium]|nr:single-stranded DNA-binding protein [Clostridiaceae bacterium]
MNRAILIGRLVRDPELRTTQNGISVCSFTLAVDRRFKNQYGERETDFIPCVAWRNTADFCARYFSKGKRMALLGSIRPRSWEDTEGNKRYITEVIAEEVYFADGKSDGNEQVITPTEDESDGNEQVITPTEDESNQEFSPTFWSVDQDAQLPFDL